MKELIESSLCIVNIAIIFVFVIVCCWRFIANGRWIVNCLSINQKRRKIFKAYTFDVGLHTRALLLSCNHSACTVNNWMTIETFFEVLHWTITKNAGKIEKKTTQLNCNCQSIYQWNKSIISAVKASITTMNDKSNNWNYPKMAFNRSIDII